jgi:transcriptional regulator with XRE-family HTH domain
MAVGKIIREKRIEMGLTQDALASLIGITQNHVARIERGAVENPRRETLINFQEALGFDLTEYMPPPETEERAQARYLSHHMIEYRKRTGRSRADIAKEIGISHHTYQQIETQRLEPTPRVLEAIADLCEMTVKEILSKPVTRDRVFNNYQFNLILKEFHMITDDAWEFARKVGNVRGFTETQVEAVAKAISDIEIKKQAQRYAANMGKPFAEVMRIWREHKND